MSLPNRLPECEAMGFPRLGGRRLHLDLRLRRCYASRQREVLTLDQDEVSAMATGRRKRASGLLCLLMAAALIVGMSPAE